MTDYRQEQRDELEAIESIYSEEIDILGDNPQRLEICFALSTHLNVGFQVHHPSKNRRV